MSPRRASYAGGRRVSFSTACVEGVRTTNIEDVSVAMMLFCTSLLSDVFKDVFGDEYVIENFAV